MNLYDRIKYLENRIVELESWLTTMSSKTEGKILPPRTEFGYLGDKTTIHPMDAQSRKGALGGTIYWNDTEVGQGVGEQPDTPKIGYHKHTHSRFAGGALIKGAVEIIEYENEEGNLNFHSQQFRDENDWKIAIEKNSKGNPVEKIGLLDLVFNPDTQTWGVATYAIDVEQCYFVKRRKVANTDEYGDPIEEQNIGDIELDENGNEKKSPLYITKEDGSQDIANSSIIWDKNGRNGQGCFRLLAVYAWSPEEEPEE